MAYVSSLKSTWEATDNSYIPAMRSVGRVPVSERLFPEIKGKGNRTGYEIQRARKGSECDDVSEDGSNYEAFENFDALPEEFRPSKQGKKLFKVMTSPKKGDSKEEPQQNERREMNHTTPSESQRKRGSRNLNSQTIQNESTNYKKEPLKTEDSEQPQKGNSLTSDKTGKQKKLNGMFFYYSSSRNASSEKPGMGHQQVLSGRKNSRAESSEKSELKNMQSEITQSRFFYSNSSHLKETNEFDVHSTIEQKKDEIKFRKLDINSLYNFRSPTASIQNKVSFVEKSIQKNTRETTVTKPVQWKSDLCRIKKPGNKPNISYEFTKTTKQSMSCVSSHIEEDDEVIKSRNLDFKKERFFRNDFRRMCSVHHNDEPKGRSDNRKDKGFDYTDKPQRKEKERPQKPTNKFEEKYNCSQCCKTKDTILVRHEVKVFHMNGHEKNNIMSHKSYQTIRPPKKDINNRRINTGDRQHCGLITGKTGKNKMTNTAEAFENTRKRYERPPFKSTDSSSKADYAHDAVSLKNNEGNNENLATLFECGREISHMIIESSVTINVFLENYKQWKDVRRITMLLFEEFEKTLSQSRNRNKRIIEVAEMVGTGCKMVQYVPHVGVSVAAKIIACLSDVVSRMFSSSKTAKSIGLDDFQLRLCLERDREATSDIYLYGLQCDLQLQETCKIIEEFHSKNKYELFEKFVEAFETGFLKELSLLSPKHPDVFYKRIERFYILLNDCQQSEESEAFCKAFEDWPDALTTISRLPIRFKTENWNSSSVLKTWEEIYNLLQNDQSTVEDVLKKIQDCICVLMREQFVIEKYATDLQR